MESLGFHRELSTGGGNGAVLPPVHAAGLNLATSGSNLFLTADAASVDTRSESKAVMASPFRYGQQSQEHQVQTQASGSPASKSASISSAGFSAPTRPAGLYGGHAVDAGAPGRNQGSPTATFTYAPVGTTLSSSSSGSPTRADSTAASPAWKTCVYYSRGYCKHGSSCRFVHSQTVPLAGTSSSPATPQQSTPVAPYKRASSPSLSASPSPSPPIWQAADSETTTDSQSEASDALSDSASLSASPARVSTAPWLAQLEAELQDILSAQASPISITSLSHLYSSKFGKNLQTQAEGPQREGSPSAGSPTSIVKVLGRLRGSIDLTDRYDGLKQVSLRRPIAQRSLNNYAGLGLDSPSSRQIYLTFPAESTFSEKDVATYFGKYGVVNDVRIPYQQKRMFGFVTFANPMSVRAVLKQGNPHSICGARVLVKPYRERSKPTERSKYPDGPRAAAVEAPSHRGIVESKLPPRHYLARPEIKPFPGRSIPGQPLQAWTPKQDLSIQKAMHDDSLPSDRSEEAEREHSSPMGEGSPSEFGEPGDCPPPGFGSRELGVRGLSLGAEDGDDVVATGRAGMGSLGYSLSGALQSGSETEALFDPRTGTRAGEDFLNLAAANLDLFGGALEDTASADDWTLDLESILPDSPFSSPQRRASADASAFADDLDLTGVPQGHHAQEQQGQPTQPQLVQRGQSHQAGDQQQQHPTELHPQHRQHHQQQQQQQEHQWQPSSLPTGLTPPDTWTFRRDAPPFVPVNNLWTGAPSELQYSSISAQPYMSSSASDVDQLAQGMSYLAVSQYSIQSHQGAALTGTHKASAMSWGLSMCSTCRQQQVVIPNSQCACCQQLLGQAAQGPGYMVPDMSAKWQVPVGTYIRTSQSS